MEDKEFFDRYDLNGRELYKMTEKETEVMGKDREFFARIGLTNIDSNNNSKKENNENTTDEKEKLENKSVIDEKIYIEKLENLLGNLTEKSQKEKIKNLIKADFEHEKISKETYLKAMRMLGQREYLQANLSVDTVYESKE